jgi:hypothetical protein
MTEKNIPDGPRRRDRQNAARAGVRLYTSHPPLLIVAPPLLIIAPQGSMRLLAPDFAMALHAFEMYTHKVHAHEVHAHEVSVPEMHTYGVHAHEMHTPKTHTHEIDA